MFRHVILGLKAARGAGPIQQARAVADNRRLWITVADLVVDPNNPLPLPLKASIFSVALAVQRHMESKDPDWDFLVAINEEVAAGLSGKIPDSASN